MEGLSNCCTAEEWYETGLCSECKEHSEFKEEESDFRNEKIK